MELKYGKSVLNLDVNYILLHKEINKKPLSADEIFNVFENNSIYSNSLTEMINNSKRILIILPDITRKSGAEYLLDRLMKLIEDAGKDFSFIFATGTHRFMTEDEKKSVLTENIYNKYSNKIITHDPDNIENHIFYGKTKRNTLIMINKAYREHDLIIPIASVSYHYFAGFGGGRKMIIPGIAARKTALMNHKLVLNGYTKTRDDKAVTGNLKYNPVHDDIVEAVMIARVHCDFYAINTILNDDGKIIDVTGGDLFLSHIEATGKLRNYTSLKLESKYDALIVSCGGYPKDINMVQAQKSLDRATFAIKEGGKIIFFAECADGYGNKYFEDFFDIKTSKEMFNIIFDDYQINRQTAYNLKTHLENYEVYLYSSFSEEDCNRMGFKYLKDISAVSEILKNEKNVGVIPFAANVFFEI